MPEPQNTRAGGPVDRWAWDIWRDWNTMEIDSLIWQYLPGELLPQIVDHLVAGCHAYRDGFRRWDVYGRVCRAWRQRFPVHHFSCLHPPPGTDGRAIVAHLQHPHNGHRHAAKLVLDRSENLPPALLARMAALLPRLAELQVVDTRWGGAACAHPSWGLRFAHPWAHFACVTTLTLRACRFHSARDVLHVLAALPRLDGATLEGVRWTVDAAAAPRRRANRLQALWAPQTSVWPLLWLWMHPHPRPCTGEPGSCYPGFSYAEGLILTSIARCTFQRLYTGSVALHPALYPGRWILSIYGDTAAETIEVHVAHDPATGRGYVQWVVLRVAQSLGDLFPARVLPDVVLLFTQLPRLTRVVLERRDEPEVGRTAAASDGEVEVLEGRFGVWTWDAARAYAQEAMRTQELGRDGEDESTLAEWPVSNHWL